MCRTEVPGGTITAGTSRAKFRSQMLNQIVSQLADVKERTYIVIIATHREGYESAETSANLTVKAAPAETP